MSGRPALMERYGGPDNRDIGCWAVTEPDHGSDSLTVTERHFGDPNIRANCVAQRDGDHYVVNGSKMFITNAETATLFNTAVKTDPFEEIDFGSFFDDYLDPGYKSPASEAVDKPSFETFLSAPVTLPDHLMSQLTVMLMPDTVREAADSIIGNLDENGYLTASLEEMAAVGGHRMEDVEAALRAVQSLEPAGVGARDVRECLIAVSIPIVFWAFLCALSYADHRFIEKETEKNGGRRPDWVW